MKKILCLLLLTSPIFSSEVHAIINISNAWISAARQGETAILSMHIQNTANTPDSLTLVSMQPTQPAISQDILLQNKEANGSMNNGPIQIPKGEIDLEPTTTHVSFTNLKQALQRGNTVALTIHFFTAGDVKVTAPVK